MLSNIQKNIIIRAVRIRQEAGERLEEILDSYPKLEPEDRKEIAAAFSGEREA